MAAAAVHEAGNGPPQCKPQALKPSQPLAGPRVASTAEHDNAPALAGSREQHHGTAATAEEDDAGNATLGKLLQTGAASEAESGPDAVEKRPHGKPTALTCAGATVERGSNQEITANQTTYSQQQQSQHRRMGTHARKHARTHARTHTHTHAHNTHTHARP